MQLLQQLMGMPPPGSDEPGAFGMGGVGGAGGLPPGLAAMLGGGGGVGGGGVGGGGDGDGDGMGQKTAPSTSGFLWRILHAVFALSMGAYILSTLPFTGSRLERLPVSFAGGQKQIFYVFATVELMMQSTRFFLERGREAQGGMLGTVAGFLPEPYRGYVLLVVRYSGIWTTMVQDAMVLVFMLGVGAWWRGGIAV